MPLVAPQAGLLTFALLPLLIWILLLCHALVVLGSVFLASSSCFLSVLLLATEYTIS